MKPYRCHSHLIVNHILNGERWARFITKPAVGTETKDHWAGYSAGTFAESLAHIHPPKSNPETGGLERHSDSAKTLTQKSLAQMTAPLCLSHNLTSCKTSSTHAILNNDKQETQV